MSTASHFREQAARVQRFLDTPLDPLTRERLTALGEHYLQKARALETESPATPSETM